MNEELAMPEMNDHFKYLDVHWFTEKITLNIYKRCIEPSIDKRPTHSEILSSIIQEINTCKGFEN